MKRKFKLEVSSGGVRMFTDIEALNKRIQLMNDYKFGLISLIEMKKRAKSCKVLFFEKDLPLE